MTQELNTLRREDTEPDGHRIGRAFSDRPWSAVSLTLTAVAADLTFAAWNPYGDARPCLTLVAFALAVWLSRGDHASIGIRPTPIQGWSWWARMTIRVSWMTGLLIAIGLGILVLNGHQPPLNLTHPSLACNRFIQMCVVAPVLEETTYRVVACGLIARICGANRTILFNGLLFAAVHFLYGNPSPENIIGGFVLAWAFLKSETILVPLILHSFGNGIVLIGQVVGWYLVHGAR